MGKKARLVGTRAAAVSLALMLAAGSAPINVLAKEVRDEAVVNAVLEDGAVRAMSAKASRKKLTKELFTNGDVSKGTTEGWTITNTERGELDVANVKALGAKGREDVSEDDTCIWVKNRETCGAGAQQDVSGKLEVGKTYTFKGKIMYKDGPDTQTFHLEIQNGPNYKWRHQILRVDAKKGEWTEFEGTYKIPEFVNTQNENCEFTADQNYVFFETPWAQNPSKDKDLIDFYVDDVSMTYETGDVELVENGDAENGAEGWTTYEHEAGKNENLKIVETDDAHSGKKALKVVNRTLTNDGFGQKFENEFKEGYTYKFSAWVKQDQFDSQDIALSIRKGTDQAFTTIDTKAVPKGEWVNLSGQYTFSEDDNRDVVSVYFETPWKSAQNTTDADRVDITADDLSIIELSQDVNEGNKDYRESSIKAELEVPDEILGVINQESEAKIKLDKLEKNGYKNLKLTLALPEKVGVADVEFNEDAINGDAKFDVKDGTLVIDVDGDDVAFDAEDGLFATLKLKMSGYVRKNVEGKFNLLSAHVDGGKTVFYDVKDATKIVNLKYLDTGAIAKKLGCSNPLYTQEFGADPYAIVYNDRVYVYMTADDYEYDANGNLKNNEYGYIKTLRVISSSDMVNWTDHGTMKIAGKDGPAKWANHSWAPAVAHKVVDGKDKFFLYFANDGSGIGVVESDSPIGPWKDPIGGYLLRQSSPGCAGVEWCFDPAVLVDDDGSAYIYFGGGIPNNGRNGEAYNPHTARVAKLGDDMISIDGEAVEIDAPAMFEDSGIFKYKGKYYYNYCTNFMNHSKEGYPGNGNIAYMVSDSPMGPFKYAGEIFDNPERWFGVGGNNHHATFVFRDKSYFIYHAQTVAKELGTAKGYRSTHIDSMSFDEDGNILPIKGTYEGISQLESLDPYKTIEAETIAWNKGIKVADIGSSNVNRELTSLDDGDWTSVAGADFGAEGADKFTARVKSKKGGSIEVRLDSPEGSLIGTLEVPAETNEYTNLSTTITKVTGERNVFFVFKGDGEELMNVDSYIFGEGEIETPDDPAPETPDQPTPDDPTPVTPDDPTPDDPTPVTPDDPTPDKPTPDTPDPDKPTPDKPTPDTPDPDKPTPETPDTPDPDKPTPETPETPDPDKPAPETPDQPAPETPDQPAPETPDKPAPETPDKPTPETPDKPAPETPDQPAPAKPEDTTKPASEPAAKASAGNGKSSTADQIAAPGDTTTLASAESGNVTINFGAKKVVLKGDKGTFKVVSGKGVKISKNGKITFKKGASEVVIGYKVEGKDVTKSLKIQAPEMEKKAAGKVSEAVALELKGTDISTAVWSTNKLKDAKISVSKDGKHVSVTCAKKGTLKVSAEINGKKYTTKVTLK